MIDKMQVVALLRDLLLHSELEQQEEQYCIKIDHTKNYLLTPEREQEITIKLNQITEQPMTVLFKTETKLTNTPWLIQKQVDQQRLLEAKERLKTDPELQKLQQCFDGLLHEDSIQVL